MATYPNNYRTGAGANPNYRHIGIMAYYVNNSECGTGAGSRLSWHVGDQGGGLSQNASMPDGYGMKTPFPPIKAGSMSAWNKPVADLSLTASLIAGGPMEGAGSVALTGSSSLSLVVGMEGTAAVATLTGDGMELKLTIGLDGTGSWTLTGDGALLSMIVPFEGTGDVATFGVGATNLKGLLSLSGEFTPFTELSPESLAASVWAALAADNNVAGTMGEKLNGAGSAGNPWTEIIESGMSAAEVLRVIASVLAGEVSGAGTGTETFKGLDGATDRVISTVDSNGNRTAVTVDGT